MVLIQQLIFVIKNNNSELFFNPHVINLKLVFLNNKNKIYISFIFRNLNMEILQNKVWGVQPPFKFSLHTCVFPTAHNIWICCDQIW